MLHIGEQPKPSPKDNEMLVKVRASSVNALDWHFMRGAPYLVRLQSGLPARTEATGSVTAAIPRQELCWSWIDWVEWSRLVWLRRAGVDGVQRWQVDDSVRPHAQLCRNTARRRQPEGDGGTQRLQA